MPIASLIVPAYNVTSTLRETLDSLTRQNFRDLEIIVVDDGSSDGSGDMAAAYGDPRIRVIQQRNRGLAGARNSGIHAARGVFIGFCDADDLWRPTKLAAHLAHFAEDPSLGLSYSGSELIDPASRSLGLFQTPRLSHVSAAHVFKRNPVGNGSAAMFRREALNTLAWRPYGENERDWWFDETFRQSEDIECWLRFALTTDWRIGGVPGALTRYRIVPNGLSAGTNKQLQAWERMVSKLSAIAPEFFQRHAPAARAYQHRYLARRAISAGDAKAAHDHWRLSLTASKRPLIEEPVKTLSTAAAVQALTLLGPATVAALMRRNAPKTTS
nr:glycosyltransferase family 2 protein [uncultured Celeribacter sp.]